MPLSKLPGPYGNAELNDEFPLGQGESESHRTSKDFPVNYRELPKGYADRLIRDNPIVSSDILQSVNPSPMPRWFIPLVVIVLCGLGVWFLYLAEPAPVTSAAASPALIAAQPTNAAAVIEYPSITPPPTPEPTATQDLIYLEQVKQEKIKTDGIATQVQAEVNAQAVKIAKTQQADSDNEIQAEIEKQETAEAAKTEQASRRTFLLQAAADERAAAAAQQAQFLTNAQRQADVWYTVSIAGAVFGAFILAALLFVLFLQIEKMRRIAAMGSWIQPPMPTPVSATPEAAGDIPADDYKDDFEQLGITRGEAYWFFKRSVSNLMPQHGETPSVRRIVQAMTAWCIEKGYATPAVGNQPAQWNRSAGHSNGSVARLYGFPLNGQADEK